MNRTLATRACHVVFSAVVIALPAIPAGAQAPSAPASGWTAPRTPWGDPDLQGDFTNVYEQATPLERPEAMKGRRLEDIKGEELAKYLIARRDSSVAGFDSSEVHAPTFWWADSLDVAKGSQAWFITDPEDGRIPPLTPQAQKRAAERAAARKANTRGPADSWTDRSLYDRCITRGFPNSMLPTLYGNSFEIVQAPGVVAIRYEMIHETRVISTTGQQVPGPAVRQHFGTATGRWEGDTLVVETTNFRPESVFRDANPDTLKVIERFRRVAPDKVQWTVTIDDADTWTRPWTFSLPLTVNEQERVHEYGCHEGNYGLANILSAARAEEAAAAGSPAR
jgi:hypothetical protein